MHADRTNRFALLLLSVLLIAAGGFGGAAAFGLMGTSTEKRTLTDNPVWRYVGQHGDWVWAAAALLALLIALLAMRWLFTLLASTDRIGEIRIAGAADGGRTRLTGSALTDAVSTEIGTTAASAPPRPTWLATAARPNWVSTVLHDDADFAAVRRRIETGALTHARAAVGDPSMPITLNLNVTTQRSARVR